MSFGIQNSRFRSRLPTGNVGQSSAVWSAGNIQGINIESGSTPTDLDVLYYDATSNLWTMGSNPGPTGATGAAGAAGPTGPTGAAGPAATTGSATLILGTATVLTAGVGAASFISLTHQALNGSTGIGVLQIGTIVDATSFVINALNATGTVETNDISNIAWAII